MPKSTKSRKPTVAAKYKNYTVPTTTRNVGKGILNASATDWTSPSKLVSAMDVNIIKTKSSEDIFTSLLDAFVALSKTSPNASIKNLASNCYKYASQTKFKQEFIEIVESRKLKIRDFAVEKRIHELANQGMNGILDIASKSMDQVVSRALNLVNDNEAIKESIITNKNEEEEEEEEYRSADEELVWNEILSSSKKTAVNPPGESQYTAEKPKLTIKMIEELELSCHMALSCIPLSKIPGDMLTLFYQYQNDNFILKSLKSQDDVFNRIRQLIDIEDTIDNRTDYGFFVWQSEREARMKQEKNVELLKVFCFCLTDFWSCCWQETFRKDHECEDHVKSYNANQIEKNFWLNSTSSCFSDGVGRNNNGQKILLMESSSAYGVEDFEHSLQDTYKLIKLSTAGLQEMIKRKQDCKASSASKLAVFGIQCIKDKLTLLKTTFDAKLENYKIMELRSCTIPTAWEKRYAMLKVFELLACLNYELRKQLELERELLRQENQLEPVNADESGMQIFNECRNLTNKVYSKYKGMPEEMNCTILEIILMKNIYVFQIQRES
ncbi:hypothetical protein BDF20DRAFT_839892 [Mycotypha africana]|uniref:uncharacterized protein n=1 Tax=Mycotypha africana TaxID=64632 RepID=UPI0023019320|nr:uncharacterized protein BDF20DRAFT_839892 [Mycotypha africana]KAI8967679.1 hypothetical protein BDF20DRAFT_839892 [Mycotypha africana]